MGGTLRACGCIASWVVATAERYAASPSSGPVCARPKPLWRIGRASCSVDAPFMRACAMMAKAQSTALLSARTTARPTCSHVQARGRCAISIYYVYMYSSLLVKSLTLNSTLRISKNLCTAQYTHIHSFTKSGTSKTDRQFLAHTTHRIFSLPKACSISRWALVTA
jgi:hypothetical protein